ncbi:protease complex subunit PrcB family protein [Oceanobacter mangrovi]|uniref:protease complex subunit PrcB family protein n=1 Tax=Oceanobacter mangrovi TaxID=2862510 RepID=UPI001C8E0DEC|nr:protease complex subunit PrcB family protein [Oceanobacter mangrovi]
MSFYYFSRPTLAICMAAGVLTLNGCVATDDTDSSTDVSYSILDSGTDPINTDESKFTKVIYNQYDYENELAYYTTDDADDIDFDTHRVVLIDLGERDSDEYALTLNDISSSDNAVTLSYTISVPDSTCTSTTSTNPYALLSLKTTKEVLIKESMETVSCN